MSLKDCVLLTNWFVIYLQKAMQSLMGFEVQMDENVR